MDIMCAWCKKDMGSKPSQGVQEGIVSHGICKECASALLGPNKLPLKDFLDAIEIPVLVVGLDVTIHYANKQAREILHKEMPSIEGLWGGKVFECVHAKQPEGCGNTIHCVGCSIRTTITDTMKTGVSYFHTPAYLCQGTPEDNQEIKFLISTERISDIVLLRIDKVGEH
jgi:hypothetical protein